jgi:photosystem II stability/assembly factor-like uncharacterized protein
MLPRTLLGLLLFLVTFPASSASTNLVWRWSNPLPFGANIADLATHPGQPTAAVAEFGQLFLSSDLFTWTRAETGTDRWLRSAVYIPQTSTNSPTPLVVVGEDGCILISTNLADFTSINLGTTNWLEGVAASDSRLVAVGDRGAIYTSEDGFNWTLRPVAFSTWLRGVTWRPGGPFVAVGENGFIATSPNGIQWTPRNSRTTHSLNRVIPLATGFCAVGENGAVVADTANSATNWRLLSTGANGDLYAAAQEFRADLPGQPVGSLLVAGDAILRSGIPALNLWIDETDPRRSAPAPGATYLAGFWNDTEAVFAGRAGVITLGSRPTVASAFQWTVAPSPPRRWLFDVTSHSFLQTNTTAALVNDLIALQTRILTNESLVAVGDGPVILQSDHGISWSTALLPTNAANIVYLGIASAPDILVAVGSSGTISHSPAFPIPILSTNSFTNSLGLPLSVTLTNFLSTLGLAWYPSDSPVSSPLQGIDHHNHLWIAAGAAGVILASTNAIHWSHRPSPVSTYLSSVAASPLGWVVSGDSGTLLSSSDGLTWTPRVSGTSNWLLRTRWLGDRFISVGQAGTLLVSTNAINWSPLNSGITQQLNDVLRINNTFYAVGNQGVVIGSSDGSNWSRLASITPKTLQGLAHADGRLITVGADGSILRAVVQSLPTPLRLAEWPRSHSDNVFLVTGEQDHRFHLDRGTNLVDWIASPPLEIEDPTGTLLLVDPAPNDPNLGFFRVRKIPDR